ncbi:hypothetical protein [Puniceibacterium sp. IMCC21224]|uniref:hypothetical protein n=1 Tax=Puniceibacterium sp. IMCC21224 TaxID=1618204 RepID=UPI00065D628F|nr:hypothetical protein [Puniceibacterium sp. IMCC21224]KMK68174.1 hypothetical protein IMCC21224_113054 [Puniceibacterium sp. IMCC21224]
MKRFMIATALTLSMAGGAMAATEGEIVQIERYLPDVDASTLTDTQVASAMNIINSSDMTSEDIATLRSVVEGAEFKASHSSSSMLSAEEIAILQPYTPGVDLTMVSRAQAQPALAVINSGEANADMGGTVSAIIIGTDEAIGEGNSATAGQVAALKHFMPDLDVSALSEAQLKSALAAVNSGTGTNEVRSQLETIAKS